MQKKKSKETFVYMIANALSQWQDLYFQTMLKVAFTYIFI